MSTLALISTVKTRQYCASGRARNASGLYESGYKKRMKKKKAVLNWCSIFHWQKACTNARPPDTAKLRWKARLSVLDSTFGCFY